MSWGPLGKLETIEGVDFPGNFSLYLFPGGEARSVVFYGSGGVSNVESNADLDSVVLIV